MMKNTYKRGFTLIELLVVIAIIGILASVVLASLNTARDKGADASIQSNLTNARSEAELFYSNSSPNTYDGVCATTGTNVIGDNLTAVGVVTSGTYVVSDTANVSTSVPVCHDSSSGWAAASALKSTTTVAWCVDSTGVSARYPITVLDTDNDVTCN